VRFEGKELTDMSTKDMREARTRMQMIFQDPISSLNPRRTVRDIIGEGLRVWGSRGTWTPERIDELMAAVGIDPRYGERKPHQFSGGQCQRISIARAVITDPKLIICDEPVSALAVSVQAQILNLLEDMKQRYGLTLVFVAHDLAVVKNVSDRVAVMYLGKMCELGPPDTLYAHPAHPYTAALLAAIPLPDPAIDQSAHQHLGGELPSPIDPPSGCRFRTRCDRAQDLCAQAEPQMQQLADDHYVACHFPLETPVAAPTVS
jgi:peptide/nickel transport system ATP-binding protein